MYKNPQIKIDCYGNGKWVPDKYDKFGYSKTLGVLVPCQAARHGYTNREIYIRPYVREHAGEDAGLNDVGLFLTLFDGDTVYSATVSIDTGKLKRTMAFKSGAEYRKAGFRQMTPEEMMKLYEIFSAEVENLDDVGYRFTHLADDLLLPLRPHKQREYVREKNVRSGFKDEVEKSLTRIKSAALGNAA